MDVDWTAFFPVAAGISVIPGANQLLGFRNAYRYGVAPAAAGVLGRLVAFAIMAVLVSLGLAALLVQSGLVFGVVKWVGVEFLVAATNPKAVFLFAALLPQFLRSAGSPAAGLLLIGFAYLFVEAATATVYIAVGSRLGTRDITAAHDRVISLLTGTCLLGFAAYLAVTLR